jgi:AmmeMemoRadiSam system protein B
MWLLRDPLQLTAQQLVMPAPMAQMLPFCDGTRTKREIHAAFCQQLSTEVDFAVVDEALAQLDAACLLENARSHEAYQALLAEFRAQPHRPPALADLSYPGEKSELTALFQSYLEDDELDIVPDWRGRGIISPHIDYQRGGPVYAKTWRHARCAVLEADIVLIFGTDHNGSSGAITLTHQPYATPYGVLPTDLPLIEKLADAIGSDAAFAEELHHRSEHSVELSAVWLHHIYHLANKDPAPMVPILCGSFHHFLMNGSNPAEHRRLIAAVETLRQELAGKNVLAVASVDFAHVGPNFGDQFPMDARRRAELTEADRRLIQSILHGDVGRFYEQISSVQDRYRICGFSSIYLLLRYLGATEGVEVAYQHCPADPEDNSLVSICGLLLE